MKQRNDFPVLNAVDIYDPHYTPKSMDETAAKDVRIVYDQYGINKIDIYDGLRKESAALIGCARETCLNEFKSYSTLIEIKIFESSRITEDLIKNHFQKRKTFIKTKKLKPKTSKKYKLTSKNLN